MNGSWPNVRGPSFGVFVTPNVLRFGRVVGSWLLDLTAQALQESPKLEDFQLAAVVVEPEAIDGLALSGPD